MPPDERTAPPELISNASTKGYQVLTRGEWSARGSATTDAVKSMATDHLMATGEPLLPGEVADVYGPLAELLTLLAAEKRHTDTQVASFLGNQAPASPFIIGIAGGVAVGKSTTARVLQALLRRGPASPTVDLLTTDGFLHPNAVLEGRGLMTRKGFPESYDQRALVDALAALRSADAPVTTPIYSHLAYDIVPEQVQTIDRPDMLIVEGLNVLQVNTRGASPDHVVVSDFFDFSIYVDAAEDDVAIWFRERLLALRSTVLQEPDAFFHRFADLPHDDVVTIARQIWADINLVNLRENVAPTRSRAHLVLEKGADHRVQRVLLRQA
ncbi:MAG TPA: type I pantothenate kinase [Acidimicrobiales bacterium]|jgi:type I pantothenate kinase|nr:type I pantothenate kinase [Acidimicrobiales bacterium]